MPQARATIGCDWRSWLPEDIRTALAEYERAEFPWPRHVGDHLDLAEPRDKQAPHRDAIVAWARETHPALFAGVCLSFSPRGPIEAPSRSVTACWSASVSARRRFFLRNIRMSNIDYVSWYSDGATIVAVLTGMPHESVQVGMGDTCLEAYANLEGTAIQSTGRDCGEAAALEWAVGAGWLDEVPESYEPDEDELIEAESA